MGSGAGVALKFVQWFVRGIQFLCAALILGVYSYFLASLHNHDLKVPTAVRAVEGISGAAVLYSLAGLLLLCCFAGLTFTSLIAIALDVAFIGAFIYVAVANKNGAGDCNGYVDTPFGKGQAGSTVDSSDGFINLPRFRTACKLQSACLAVAIIAIIFFVFSILVELALVRHHRKEKRFGPSPKNNYTSGSGKTGGVGFFGRVFHRRGAAAAPEDETGLPVHTQPDQLNGRQSYATETTAVNAPVGLAYGGENGGYKKHESPYEVQQQQGVDYGYNTHGHGQPPAQNYNYNDGVYDRV